MENGKSKWGDTPVKMRPMTPDEVLAVISDINRFEWGGEPIPEHDDSLLITREQSIYNEMDDIEEIEYFIEWFKVDIDKDYRDIVSLYKNAQDLTFGELCDFIAPRARIEDIDAVNVMGLISWEAGVFRVVRNVLKDMGADVSELKPSSYLEPYLIAYPEEIMTRLVKLFPGYLPLPYAVYNRGVKVPHDIFVWLSGIGVILFFLFHITGCVTGNSQWNSWALILLPVWVFSYIIVENLERRMKPRTYVIGEFKTFRDLCFALAVKMRSDEKNFKKLEKQGRA